MQEKAPSGSTGPSERDKNRIDKRNTRDRSPGKDRQKIVRRSSETVSWKQGSLLSDDKTVRTDDAQDDTVSEASRIDTPDGETSDGTGGSDATSSLISLSSVDKVLELSREVRGLPPDPPAFAARAREQRAQQAAARGLTAKWARAFGFIDW